MYYPGLAGIEQLLYGRPSGNLLFVTVSAVRGRLLRLAYGNTEADVVI